MCAVSFVGDQITKTWPATYPNTITQPPNQTTWVIQPQVNRAEFDALRAEVENLKKLLKLAKAMDEATGQPDCEMDEKVALIKSVAEALGVDLEDVFG